MGTPQSLLCGERRSQDTGGVFCLQKMEHCILCFDEVSAAVGERRSRTVGKESTGHRKRRGTALAVEGFIKRESPLSLRLFPPLTRGA